MLVTKIGLFCYIITVILGNGGAFPEDIPSTPESFVHCQYWEDGSYTCDLWSDALEPFECLDENESGIDYVVTLPNGEICSVDFDETNQARVIRPE